MEILRSINENIVWGAPMLILFTVTGVIFTLRLRFIQIRGLPAAAKQLFSRPENGGNGVSPFRALTAALGATLGTGNIVAVSAAVVFGGAGAVFWMWASALLNMATGYSENYLGKKYGTPHKNAPFAYIKKAFGGKKAGGTAAGVFAVSCLFAGIGMGSMAQINSAAEAMRQSAGVPLWITGALCALLVAFLSRGGLKRLSGVTSWLIPLSAAMYIIGCLAVIAVNLERLPYCFSRIFDEAFSLKAVSGGAAGSVMMNSLKWGVKRGVFSNEAGVGTTVMIHSASDCADGRSQGLWAMLQVFVDTVIICTLTALCVIITGADAVSSSGAGAAYYAFSQGLGQLAGAFICVSVFIFAVSTTAGWWIYAKAALKFLRADRWAGVYFALFVFSAFSGAVIDSDIVWELSDLFNGIMAVPNLTALILLRREVA